MRRKLTIFLLIGLFLILMLIYSFYNEKLNEVKIDQPVNTNYILISINNSVRLYRDDKLIQIYDNIKPSSLPLTDQDNLRSGIKLNSMNEVAALIEDFDG